MPEHTSNNFEVLIKGGTIVNHDNILKADVYVENGVIKSIGENLNVPTGVNVIDASGKFVLPGGVDPDCFLSNNAVGYPLADNIATGSQAAILGGTTTIVNTILPSQYGSLKQAVEEFRSMCDGQMACDYAFRVWLPQVTSTVCEELETLVKSIGVTQFLLQLECFKHQGGEVRNTVNENEFIDLTRVCHRLGVLPSVLAAMPPSLVEMSMDTLAEQCPTFGPEGHLLAQPERFEADVIRRAVLLSSQAGFICPLLISRVHSVAAVQMLAELRRSGSCVLFGMTTAPALTAAAAGTAALESKDSTCEVCCLSRDWATAAGHVSNPPLRPSVEASDVLKAHLVTSDLFAVGSGHKAVKTAVRAALGLKDFRRLPDGVAAVGWRMLALWQCTMESVGGIDPCAFVAAVSANPARLLNLYPQKGCIAVGSDADIVIWKPTPLLVGEHSYFEKLLPPDVINVFTGLNCGGFPETVMLRGRVVVEDSNLLPDTFTCGKYLSLNPFCPLLYDRVNAIEARMKEQREFIKREPYSGNVFDPRPKEDDKKKEQHFFRKEEYDNIPREALPPGQRQVHTSVKVSQRPGGASTQFW